MKSPEHQQISKELLRAIADGEYVEGQRLPSEADLVTRFATSRPTVAHHARTHRAAGHARA